MLFLPRIQVVLHQMRGRRRKWQLIVNKKVNKHSHWSDSQIRYDCWLICHSFICLELPLWRPCMTPCATPCTTPCASPHAIPPHLNFLCCLELSHLILCVTPNLSCHPPCNILSCISILHLFFRITPICYILIWYLPPSPLIWFHYLCPTSRTFLVWWFDGMSKLGSRCHNPPQLDHLISPQLDRQFLRYSRLFVSNMCAQKLDTQIAKYLWHEITFKLQQTMINQTKNNAVSWTGTAWLLQLASALHAIIITWLHFNLTILEARVPLSSDS